MSFAGCFYKPEEIEGYARAHNDPLIRMIIENDSDSLITYSNQAENTKKASRFFKLSDTIFCTPSDLARYLNKEKISEILKAYTARHAPAPAFTIN